MIEKCYLNGENLPLHEAKISVLDRGFLFGDGVYEVLPVFFSRPYFLHRHLRRLKNSLQSIRLNFQVESLLPQIFASIAQCAGETQLVYIQISRGVEANRQHCPSPATPPTVLVFSRPCEVPPPTPVACISQTDFRWQQGQIKSTSLLAAVMLADLAHQNAAQEVMLFRQNKLTEGLKSNYLIFNDNVLLSPPFDHNILPGISCQVILMLAEKLGLACQQRPITQSEVKSAQEILICSSSRGVAPVTSVDGVAVANGEVGDVFNRLLAGYHNYIAEHSKDTTYNE